MKLSRRAFLCGLGNALAAVAAAPLAQVTETRRSGYQTFHHDKDMDCLVEVRDGANYFDERPKAPTVIGDIEPGARR